MANHPIIIGREFIFEAAHQLPEHPGKCRIYHGHTYKVIVEIDGFPDPLTGMVVDFYDLKRTVQKYIDALDHQDLCQVLPGMRTTVENLVVWFANKLAEEFSAAYHIVVEIQEGEGGWARYDCPGRKI